MNTVILEQKAAHQMATELGVLLADTYLLYVKTQNFHWNIVDRNFYSFHKFFEEQYEELAEAIDIIAERIRALGKKSPGSMREFLDLTRLKESSSELSSKEMLISLMKDHESIIDWLRPAIEQSAKCTDQGTSDMCINRLRFHEKMVWMIGSHLIS